MSGMTTADLEGMRGTGEPSGILLEPWSAQRNRPGHFKFTRMVARAKIFMFIFIIS